MDISWLLTKLPTSHTPMPAPKRLDATFAWYLQATGKSVRVWGRGEMCQGKGTDVYQCCATWQQGGHTSGTCSIKMTRVYQTVC